MSALVDLASGMSDGTVEVVDLTATLSEQTPVIRLPEPLANTPGLSLEELSRYDDRGPAWYWNVLHVGEHAGTHFDAPVHWETGKDGPDVSEVPPGDLVGPAAVIDKSEEAERDPDFLLEVEHVRQWEEEHGALPEGGWLLYRTGWDARADDEEAFLNVDEDGVSHTPGISVECARWLAEQAPIVGLGVETVGTDAGAAADFDPPFPVHSFLLGEEKYGVTQLQNLDRLPATGSLVVVAPLPVADGSGSPCRVLALTSK